MQSELCSLEERQLALKKALESRTFGRSEQLKAFLRYICEAETLRPGGPLTEYVIGVEVLGRPEGYSPAEDSSVRTRAYELRQKLERLYTKELPDEPVQISIPKGTYSPSYILRSATPLEGVATISLSQTASPARAATVIVETSPIRPSPMPPRWIPVWLTVAIIILTAVLTSAATWFVTHPATSKPMTDPVLAEAWGPLAEHEGTVVLSLATPLSLVVGPKEHDVFASKSYPAPEETYPMFREHRPLAKDESLGLTFSDNMIAIGTMNAALMTAKTLRNFGTSYQLLPERVATISALHGRNAVLFGAPVDSDAISLALADMPLTVDFEPAVREFVVRDRATGSYVSPIKGANGEFTTVYGLLTVKTSRDSDRRVIESIIFSGITSVGVHGASEYFSSPVALNSLRTLFKKEGLSGFPASYQVIVKCTYTNLLLFSFDYYSHRTVHLSL